MEAKTSLMDLLATIKDPRGNRGKRHPLVALLALSVVAMLAGQKSYEAIVQYGKERGWSFLEQLGFTRRRGLCKATYSRVFRGIDVVAFEDAISAWIKGRLDPEDLLFLAIDGKTLRGTREAGAPGVHLLSAYAQEVAAVVAQIRVDAKTNEHKAALELLGILPLKGCVVTMDAMFTHRDVCEKIIEAGGDYILPVKENQPVLLADIKAVFAGPPAGLSPPPDRGLEREFRASDRG